MIRGRISRTDVNSDAQCRVELWRMAKPPWQAPTPLRLGIRSVSHSFAVHWTIGGPRSEHWVEVSCPGYETFRTERFEAPSSVREHDLGIIRLKVKAVGIDSRGNRRGK